MGGNMARTQEERMEHAEIQMYLYLTYRQHTNNTEMEKLLLNRRKADLYFEYLDGRYIIEVKTEVKHSIIQAALEKYASQCDFLIIAAPSDQFYHVRRNQILAWTEAMHEKVGKLAVSWGRIDIIRHPVRLHAETPQAELPLAGASTL